MIAEDMFRVVVRPNAKKSEVLGFDGARQAYRVAIAAPAEDNRANLELVKFLSKEMGRKVRVVSGLRGRLKTIKADK